jgi:type IV pilus assembly protein PilA
MKNIARNKGFTLIEILVVIGIIAILATIVIIAINPARQFAQARNTQRLGNINTILNAIGQRISDNKGTFPTATGCAVSPIASTTYTISSTVSGTTIDMSCLVPTYIPSQLPVDPQNGSWTSGSTYDTKYSLVVDSLGRYTVCAPNSVESALGNPPQICVTR